MTKHFGEATRVTRNPKIFSRRTLAMLALAVPMGALAQPAITNVQNNYSYLVAGQPNYGIAPSTIFIVVGTGLAGATTVSSLQSSAAGLPTTLNGASASVTVNGVTTHPAFYYAIATQLAMVLPAATPVGTGTITIAYNGQNASAPIKVVQSALGLDSLYGTGAGIGVATNATTGAVFNYTTSAAPGQTIVLWGSGLGADTADSDTTFTSTPHAVNVPFTLYIGGIQANVLYAGSSGYPGLNQINVTIPPGVPSGCGIPIVAVGGGLVSNTVNIPVNPGGGVCSDPFLGITGTQIQAIGAQASYNTGTITLTQGQSGGVTFALASASFQRAPGSNGASGAGLVSLGNCTITSSATSSSSTGTTDLDVGTLTIAGSAGSQTFTGGPGSNVSGYSATLPAGFVPPTGGSFTFNATGGTRAGISVGAFSTTLNLSSPAVWSNAASLAAIDRTQSQTVTWTGGLANAFIYILGSSRDAATGVSAAYLCFAPSTAGQFTIPSYVLSALPAGSGSLALTSYSGRQSFSATGLDQGFVNGISGTSINVTYK